MATKIASSWRHYRRLSPSAQVGIGVGVVALYSLVLVVGIVALTGGKKVVHEPVAPHEDTKVEAQVRKAVQSAGTVQHETGDVSTFRKPEVQRVRCANTECNVTYLVAIPGGGRILEQQAFMVSAIFGKLDVNKLTLRVVRSLPTGPLASKSTEEETAGGLPLMITECTRPAGKPGTDPFSYMGQSCKSQRGGDPGSLKAGGGGTVTLPASAPEYQPGNPRYPTGQNGNSGN